MACALVAWNMPLLDLLGQVARSWGGILSNDDVTKGSFHQRILWNTTTSMLCIRVHTSVTCPMIPFRYNSKQVWRLCYTELLPAISLVIVLILGPRFFESL